MHRSCGNRSQRSQMCSTRVQLFFMCSCFTCINFVKNQLSLVLICLSLLSTSHSRILPHSPIQASTCIYSRITLLMDRSTNLGTFMYTFFYNFQRAALLVFSPFRRSLNIKDFRSSSMRTRPQREENRVCCFDCLADAPLFLLAFTFCATYANVTKESGKT